MTNRVLLLVASTLEAVTGLGLLLAPASGVRLLLGKDVTTEPLAVVPVAALGLLSSGIACWPRVEATLTAIRVMLIYNLSAAAYLGYLRFGGNDPGRRLLPALAVHAILSVLFLGAWFKHQPANAIRQ
jgi:hypothetical protein